MKEVPDQPVVTYKNMVTFYHKERQKLPAPHPQLTQGQQVAYRQIQSGSFPHPLLLSRMFPNQYRGNCPVCQEIGILQHMVGECRFNQEHPPPLPPTTTPLPLVERWENLLSSPALENQLRLVTRSQVAKTAYGIS